MKHSLAHAHGLATLALWALAVTANAAAQHQQLPDPADPNAAVPPTRYEAVMATPPAAREASPAANWKELNRVVASYDPMAATMEMAVQKPAEPAPVAAAPKPAPDPHAHHRPGGQP